MSASGLAAHLSPAELGQRYRAARCPVERSHLQIVWLLSLGRSEREVAQVTGYGRRWVGEVARRYDEDGPGGLGDRRRGNVAPSRSWAPRARRRCGPRCPRRPPTAACGPVPRWRRGWRSGSAARCGRSAAGTTSGSSATARRCRGRGTPRRRAPRSRRRTKKARRGGGRTSRAEPGPGGRGLGLRRAPARPEAGPATAMGSPGSAADRGRATPLRVALPLRLRPPGHRRGGLVRVQHRRRRAAQRRAGGVRRGGRRRRGQADRPGPRNAGWHISGDLVVPPGIELAFLPPYTPELQPAEHLWPLADEAVANKHFATPRTSTWR